MANFHKSTPEEYRGLISQASAQHEVPTEILSALLYQESAYKPDVIKGSRKSSAGAQGIAQFMPGTAKELGIDPLNPDEAIPGAAQYLKRMFDQFGTWDLALAAYNAGPGNVQKAGGIPDFEETQNYVKNVMKMASEAPEIGEVVSPVPPVSLPPAAPTLEAPGVATPFTPPVTPEVVPPKTGADIAKTYALGQKAGVGVGETAPVVDAMLGKAAPVTQTYGNYNPALEPRQGINWGTDFRANIGDEIKNPFNAELEVISVVDGYGPGGRGRFDQNEGYGNQVVVKNTATGEVMQLSHLNKGGTGNIKPGDKIAPGQKFAETGNSGNVTGPHLDLETFDAQGKVKDAAFLTPKPAFTPTGSMVDMVKFESAPAATMKLPENLGFSAQRALDRNRTASPAFKTRSAVPLPEKTTKFLPAPTKKIRDITTPLAKVFGKFKPKEVSKNQEALKTQEQLQQPDISPTVKPLTPIKAKPKPQIGPPAPVGSSAGPAGPARPTYRAASTAPRIGPVRYVTRPGDTPSGVARKLGISNWRNVWGGDPRKMPVGLRVGGGGYGGGGFTPTTYKLPIGSFTKKAVGGGGYGGGGGLKWPTPSAAGGGGYRPASGYGPMYGGPNRT